MLAHQANAHRLIAVIVVTVVIAVVIVVDAAVAVANAVVVAAAATVAKRKTGFGRFFFIRTSVISPILKSLVLAIKPFMKTKTLLLLFSFKIFAFQPVDINQASVEQIGLLPGVGEKLAKNIKDYRQKHGAITDEENLLKVSGITEKKLEKMRNHVIFGKSLKKPKKLSKIAVQTPKLVIPLDELEKMVLAVYGLDTKIDDNLKKRVRLYAWAPEFSAMADMGKNDITQRKPENKSDMVSRQGGDFGIGIKATFNFEKLIFNTHELDVLKLSLSRAKEREQVLEKLHKSYFRYKQALLENDNNLKIELEELTAALDSMSNGAFSSYQKDGNAL